MEGHLMIMSFLRSTSTKKPSASRYPRSPVRIQRPRAFSTNSSAVKSGLAGRRKCVGRGIPTPLFESRLNFFVFNIIFGNKSTLYICSQHLWKKLLAGSPRAFLTVVKPGYHEPPLTPINARAPQGLILAKFWAG